MIAENAKNELLSLLDNRILLCDGAMGTVLQSKGMSSPPEFLNLNKEGIEIIKSVHLSYLNSGSDIIQSNTFGSNPVKLKAYGLEEKIKTVNTAAVEAAKEALYLYRSKTNNGKQLFVAGNIGPLGQLLEPAGTISQDSAVDYFFRQAEILIENNVDLIVIETIMDLNEAIAAIKAVRKISPVIPVACTLSFAENGVTMMGNEAGSSIKKIFESGADIAGANCGVGSDSMIKIVKIIREANPGKRLFFQPNAGLPQLKEGKTVYNETAEIMAANISKYLEFKPSIIGACCGSTPEHIKAIARLLKDIYIF